jgi:hypothetical protein
MKNAGWNSITAVRTMLDSSISLCPMDQSG